MVSINWCLKLKKGIEIIESNENMSESYLKMAEESLRIIKKVKEESKIWFASTTYYSLYYALYSVMMKIGIKCEIHSCTIEFMKRFLINLYNEEDIELLENAFEIRQDVQYYPNRLFNLKKLNLIADKLPDFFIKTKEIISNLSEKEIEEIRLRLKNV
jgi:uncharacterized protein (UPF0332 family)